MTTQPATFPNAVLAYLEVAVSRPLRPGAVSHRPVYYRVTCGQPGRTTHEYLTGAACQPAGSRPSPVPDREGNTVMQAVPDPACSPLSAAWAQAHGAVRCTDPACYPLQPGEQARPGPADVTTPTAAAAV
jgi:hypothetical protein